METSLYLIKSFVLNSTLRNKLSNRILQRMVLDSSRAVEAHLQTEFLRKLAKEENLTKVVYFIFLTSPLIE